MFTRKRSIVSHDGPSKIAREETILDKIFKAIQQNNRATFNKLIKDPNTETELDNIFKKFKEKSPVINEKPKSEGITISLFRSIFSSLFIKWITFR